MEALTRAVESGKSAHIGFSEWAADQIQAAIDMTRDRQVRVEPAAIFDAVAGAGGGGHSRSAPQTAFRKSSGRRSARACFPANTIPDAPPPRDSRAASEEMGGWMDRLMRPAVLRAVQKLKPIAEEAGLTLPQFALAWVLREPNVASAIIGASRPEQVRENCGASGVVVDTQLFLRAETIVDEALGRVETA